MDAILSLPVIGYLLMPSLGTYSASLNLLFFYMTWSTLVLSHPPIKVEIIGTLAVRIIFFVIPSAFFLLFDTLLPSLSVGIKAQGAAALPTRTGGVAGARSSRKRDVKGQWWQVVGMSLFNVLLGVAIQAGLQALCTEVLHIATPLRITTTLPMPWSIAMDVAKCLVLREVIQYYTHRFILHASKSNLLSRLHNTYFHSLTTPFSFSVHNDHPIPYILLRIVPIYLPAIALRLHLLTYLLFLSLISLEETLTSSGYNVIPGIMLGGFTRRQDLHSQTRGRGNYGPWGFIDWFHGTSVGPDVVEDIKDEADKHRVKERGGKAWKDVKDSAGDGVKALNGRRRSMRNKN